MIFVPRETEKKICFFLTNETLTLTLRSVVFLLCTPQPSHVISSSKNKSSSSHHGRVYLRHSVVQAQLAQLQRKVDELPGLLSDEVPHHVRVSFLSVRPLYGRRAGGRTGVRGVRAYGGVRA